MEAHTGDIVEKTVHINAPPETVFEFFCDPARMIQWMGIEAELEPEPGGLMRVRMSKDNLLLGRYIEVRRPERLAVVAAGGDPGPDQRAHPSDED